MTEESKTICPECGAGMHIDEDQLLFVCDYCQHTEPLDPVTAARLNSKDAKEAEFARLERERNAASQRNQSAQRAASKKSLRRAITVMIAVFVIIAAASAGFSAIVDSMESKARLQEHSQTFTWPDTGLSQQLPKPAQTTGKVLKDNQAGFSAEVSCSSEDEFNEYVKACEDAGFTVDSTGGSHSFRAYNEEGYYLDLFYYTSYYYMSIDLDPPMEMEALDWPVSGMGSEIPRPKQLVGKVVSESDDYYSVYVGNTDLAAYKAYVTSCIKAGFDKDYSRSGDYFYGHNKAGDYLNVDYKGFNTMRITVSRRS